MNKFESTILAIFLFVAWLLSLWKEYFMRTIIALIIVGFIFYNWNTVCDFVVNNTRDANTNITKWMVDHTPKK